MGEWRDSYGKLLPIDNGWSQNLVEADDLHADLNNLSKLGLIRFELLVADRACLSRLLEPRDEGGMQARQPSNSEKVPSVLISLNYDTFAACGDAK